MTAVSEPSTIRGFLRRHGGAVLVSAAALLLASGMLSLLGSIAADGAAETAAKVAELKDRYTEDLAAAEADLTTAHEQLLDQLPGAHVERVRRDDRLARSVALAIAESSSSTSDLHALQQRFDARFAGAEPTSRVLTTFLPEWISATEGAHFRLASFESQTIDVRGLDCSYVGVAQLEQIGADESSPARILLMTYSTSSDGAITALEVDSASDATRTAWQRGASASGAAPSASPAPTETPAR